MKFVKILLKIIATLLLAGVFTLFVSVTAASYYAVKTLTKIPQDAPDVDHNLKELTRIGQNYILEIEQYEDISKDIEKQKKTPPLCATLCNGSSLDQERFLNERTNYLRNFYNTQKSQALQDPQFRIKLEEMTFISKVFPNSVRTFLTEALDEESAAEKNQWRLTFHLERLLFQEAANIKTNIAAFKNDSRKLDVLKGLAQSCHMGTTPKKVVLQECEKEFN